MHPLAEIAIILGGTYLHFLAFALRAADRVIFRCGRSTYRDGPRISKITADDGTRLSALHLRAAERRGVVLFLHGNAEDLGDILGRLEAFRERGYSVLAIDYRGYGTTPGLPSEANVIADARVALRHLCVLEAVAPRDVIIYGRSMGGGPGVVLAVEEGAGALILDGAFTSAFRVVTRVPLLPGDRFRNLARLPALRCPVLVIHGTRDRTVPFSHGRRLARAARGATHLWVEGAGHNDLVEMAGEMYWQAIDAQVAKVAARPTT